MNTMPLIQLLISHSLQLSQLLTNLANIKASFCFFFSCKDNHIIFSWHNQVNFYYDTLAIQLGWVKYFSYSEMDINFSSV